MFCPKKRSIRFTSNLDFFQVETADWIMLVLLVNIGE